MCLKAVYYRTVNATVRKSIQFAFNSAAKSTNFLMSNQQPVG